MKLILQQDIENFGKKYDVKSVKDGYARHFLLPRKLAAIATDSALKDLEKKKALWEKEEKELVTKLRDQAEKLSKEKIEFPVNHTEGTAFGSIRDVDLKDRLEDLGYSNFEVLLEKPLKTLGDYQIDVDFGRGVATKVSVSLRASD